MAWATGMKGRRGRRSEHLKIESRLVFTGRRGPVSNRAFQEAGQQIEISGAMLRAPVFLGAKPWVGWRLGTEVEAIPAQREMEQIFHGAEFCSSAASTVMIQ